MRILFSSSVCLFLLPQLIYSANNNDRFNYRGTVGNDYGPDMWGEVTCTDVGNCQGWPDGWELGIGWRLEDNNCQSCPETGNDCGLHRQSPIDLDRDDSVTGHDPECYDYHWMAYQDGSCEWHDIIKNGYSMHSNNFQIRRHALQILQPVDETGKLQCDNGRGEALFPRLDYSKGFPDFWHLSHTEITVPSEHTQEGKRYDAEVHLAHFYSVDHERRVGKVAIFMEADESSKSWNFLDKLICQWREVEEEIRDECGLESVPPYPGCRNPTRNVGETDLPYVDPYPFIDCDSVQNSQRICKPTSCCESERSQGDYCQNQVYGRYGDEVVGSICWWCCPGKLLAPATPTPSQPTSSASPTQSQTANSEPPTLSQTSGTDPPTASQSTGTDPPTQSQSTGTDPPTQSQSTGTDPPTQSQSTGTDPPTQSQTTATDPPTQSQTTGTDPPTQSQTTGTDPPTQSQTTATDPPTQSQSTATDPPTLLQPTNSAPTIAPLQPASSAPVSSIVCSDYDGHPDINIQRICKDGGCCDPLRSSTDHCHFVYKFFGESMEDVCSQCCQPSKSLAPAPPQHPTYPPIDCTSVTNPFRICKPNSCCSAFPSPTDYCQEVSVEYAESLASICWYCCSEPVDIQVASKPGAPVSPPPTPASPSSAPASPSSAPAAPSSASAAPSSAPAAPSSAPASPRAAPTTRPDTAFVCSDYDGHPDINIQRICKDGGCCDPLRSSTDHCHFVYKFFDESMEDVCSQCCQPSKSLAPAPPQHPTYPPIDCTSVTNPFRICKPNSCCSAFPSPTDYCQEVSVEYSENLQSICWYCCSEPTDINTSKSMRQAQEATVNRNLRVGVEHGNGKSDAASPTEDMLTRNNSGTIQNANQDFGMSSTYLSRDYTPGENRKLSSGSKQINQVHAEESERLRRLDSELTGDNFINVPYSPYEWMRKVKTEYYFRYEGTQMVPPCFETVHYRVMKDPIRIHPNQLAELERLLAWKVAPKDSQFNECQRDTAGKERPGSNGNAVDLNRPLQSYNNIHRKVFCACKDWDSKFQEDIDWCKLDPDQRSRTHPYNFESGGGY